MIAVLGLSAICIGCGGDDRRGTNNPNAEKAIYSVTVYSPDDEPLSGVTVSWRSGSNVIGSAETDSDGYAAANIPLGTYSIKLDGYAAGLSYDDVTVSSTMREIFVTLIARTVTYTATVLDKFGAPAVGVIVSWTDGKTIVGTAVTGADGKAACDIAYGDYTVTLANLPNGNLLNDDLAATGDNPNVTTQLINGVAATYSVTVKSEGGLLFKKQAVMVYRYGNIVTSGMTDDKGVFAFSASPDTYTVSIASMPTEGYTA